MTKLLTGALAMLIVLVSLGTDVSKADTVVGTEALKILLVGKKMRFHGGGESAFKRNGTYRFGHRRRHARGTYKIANNKVCIDFHGGGKTCFRFRKTANGSYYSLNDKGKRIRILNIR